MVGTLPGSTSEQALSKQNEVVQNSARFWATVYRWYVWPGIAVFLGSLAWMWYESLLSLFTKGGFNGIAGWLSWGCCLVAVRTLLLYGRLQVEKTGTRELKWRLRIIFLGTVGNLVANLVAIGVIVANLAAHRLAWTRWDTICSYVALGALVVSVVIWAGLRRFEWSPKAAIATLTVGTRAFQQGFLVLSSQLAMIPAGTLWGLAGVASQQAILSFIEYRKAVHEGLRSRQGALLVLWADVLNMFSACIPLGGWLLSR